MRLAYTDEQRELGEVFRSLFAETVTSESLRAATHGFDAALWSRLSADGTTAIATPAGGDARVGDLVQIVREAGRSLAPVPLAEHYVGSHVLARADPTRSVPGVVAFAPERVRGGVAHGVPGGAVATHVLVLDGPDLLLIDGPDPKDARPNLAMTPLADVPVTAGTVIARGEDAADFYVRGVTLWRTLLGALLTGAAEAVLDLAVDYVMERKQFGVPIGSFQALQQQLADLPARIDGSTLLVGKAAWAIDSEPESVLDIAHNDITDPETLAGMAYLFAGETAKRATACSLQAHGGYGYSEEYDVQLYYRKVRGWALMGGQPGDVRRGLARRMGLVA